MCSSAAAATADIAELSGSGDKQRNHGARSRNGVSGGVQSNRAVNACACVDSDELFPNFTSCRPPGRILQHVSIEKQSAPKATAQGHYLVQTAHHDRDILGSKASWQGAGHSRSLLVAQPGEDLVIIKPAAAPFAGWCCDMSHRYKGAWPQEWNRKCVAVEVAPRSHSSTRVGPTRTVRQLARLGVVSFLRTGRWL
jgi:hypothetical protein